MKSRKLKYLETILRWMAIVVIYKYNPTIIGITGSVGKTSAKEAVFLVLSSKFRARKNEKNYNNEIGIPLTIIGAESGNRSLWKWFKVFAKWLAVVILPVEYPEILILEMGVDHPGDMKYLTSFIPVKIGIMTSISSSHLEFFRDIDHIAKEKGKILEALPEIGTAIINADDKRVSQMKDRISAKIMTFGLSENAGTMASNINYIYEKERPEGINFKINYRGKSVPVRLHNILAPYQVYAALAGACTGISMKINLVDVAESLEQFSTPPGRMNLIGGVESSFIIDDTYNSSPASAIAALTVLRNLKAFRKIAVLGDMLELGEEMEKGHKQAARQIFEMNADLFFAVGDKMKLAVRELQNLGYPQERVHHFEDPIAAGDKLREFVRKGDLILIKGSQSMRMEKIVEKIMANPSKSREILCRQSAEWKKKPFIKP